MNVNVAIIGATGLVGRAMLDTLIRRKFPINELYLFASAKSDGATVAFGDKTITVRELNESNIDSAKIDYALFSAGSDISKHYAPLFAKRGTVVIDNSAYWRMEKSVPLVVPEVNPQAAFTHNGIIANPNCSTIQAVVALKPLYDKYGIKRIVYSTYQAASGAGKRGLNDLETGEAQKFPHPIKNNIIPHIDVFADDMYTKEELKMINETRKILGDESIKITATTVRVPVAYGHSESINVELKSPVTRDGALSALSSARGLVVCDDPQNNVYPMPLYAVGRDEVFVGRVRIDDSVKNGLNLWVVADNILKGAATNAVQIAELLNSKT